jgi:hypothetical protein
MGRQFLLQHQIEVNAPIERCFLLSTSIAIVQRELHMHPVRGRTSGLVTGGDTVLWKGWQLGLPQVHESLIEDFRPPVFFRDRMIAGRFRSFQHDHAFEDLHNGSVRLSDELRFTMPWGILGATAGQLVLLPHIRGLLHRRFALLKRLAETDDWRDYLPAQSAPSQPSPTNS